MVDDLDIALTRWEDEATEVTKELDDTTISYAILSHRWTNEVSYKEIMALMKMEEEEREEVRQRDGYRKIIESCKQAIKDRYEWLWIDTCCIDKRSSAELNDVDGPVFPTRDENKFDQSNGWPQWFMRGWTLQELIAPKRVEFFNKDWVCIGNKRCLAPVLREITGIPCEVLRDGLAAKRLSVAQIMSWAADWRTTRVEDRAYSLMGLFGVNMPMLYGEGKKAFQRLQLEILRVSSDHSIFAWRTSVPRTGSVLADDPSDFWDCRYIRKVEPGEFIDRLIEEYIEEKDLGHSEDIDGLACHQHKLATLQDVMDSQQFRIFTVSNAGIQVFLPVVPSCPSPSHLRAILACTYYGSLVTIDLVSSGSSFDRTSTDFSLPVTYPEFKALNLTHHRDTSETRREFALDDKHALYYGFTRWGTYPRKFTGNIVTLSSLTDDLIVIVYAKEDARSRFAVGLGYYLGRGWVHIVHDEPHAIRVDSWVTPASTGSDLSYFARMAYDQMWNARGEHSQRMPGQERGNERLNDHFVKHAHLPQSILAARVVWGRWEMDNFKVMVDVEQCPGCCDGPCTWTATSNDCGGLDTPGLVNTVCRSHSLGLDGCPTQLGECSGHRISLGDYGDYSDGNFKCTGNIFEDMTTLGSDPMDSPYRPVVSSVSDYKGQMQCPRHDYGFVAAPHAAGAKYLALRQPKGISLPANEHLVLLLKALSSRLVGKYLVMTTIQCSDFYEIKMYGARTDSGDDSASKRVSYSTEPEVLTPLCIIASPQVWRRELPCVQRREQFKNIREHFYTLMYMYQPGTEACHKSTTEGAIEFLSDLFGLQYLSNFVGNIKFFERLSLMMETASLAKGFVGTVEKDAKEHPPKLSFVSSAMTWNLSKGNQKSSDARDPRLEVVVPLLLRRCHVLRRNTDDVQKMEDELKAISHTPSAYLLMHIGNAFRLVTYLASEHQASRNYYSHVDYDRQINSHSVVQEIEELKVKLDVTEDDDERRTLEEDVTGKILWLCWCGICSEVDELLPKVLNCIQNEGNVKALLNIHALMYSTLRWTVPDDDQAHLRRIMFDAGAGISKHQLFVSA